MTASVRNLLLSGIIWNFFEKILIRGISFIVGIALARLLTPDDYGLIGMVSIFLALSNTFIDSGFTQALIQKKDCEQIDYSTAFVTNISISILLYVVLFFFSPLIASFFDEPLLVPLTRVVSLTIVFGSFNVVQRARLQSLVDFKALAKVNVVASISSGLLGVTLAIMKYGVWALVMQQICATIVPLIIFPFFSKWHPSLRFSKLSFKRLWKFGSRLLVTSLVGTIMGEISTLCIGKMYKGNQLGLYTKAKELPQMASTILYQVIGGVTFPLLSELQDDKDHLVSVYRKSLYYTALLSTPLMILAVLLSKPIILLLFTEKWSGCIAIMQWFFLAKLFTPLSALNMNMLNAIGRSDLYMKVDFSKIPLSIIILAITIPISVRAIVIGLFINSFICFFINAYIPGKIWGYGAWQQIKDWKWIILSLIIMSLVVYVFTLYFDNNWILIFGGGILGLGSYLLCCILFKMIDRELIDDLLIKLRIKRD